jgi:HPt (histidine-containing phosphotransfer) domain-containing protein
MTDESLVDARVLESLSAELYGSAEIARRFLGDFQEGWDCRIGRLRAGLSRGDLDDAFVVILSIRTTSEMVGAPALARLAAEMQQLANGRRLTELAEKLPALEAIADRTFAEFRSRQAS